MEVLITEATGIKRATGIIRHGAVHITLPKRWARKDKDEATEHLKRVLLKKAIKEQRLLSKLDQWLSSGEGQSQLITIDTLQSLEGYVRQLNKETYQVPLKTVRIGQARFSRLAQMNIETRTMTVSQYCLKGVPEPALRYLIIHELAHLIEANHSKRFWTLVEKFVPDYKHQSDVIKAFHKRAVDIESHMTPINPPQALPPVTQNKAIKSPTPLFQKLLLPQLNNKPTPKFKIKPKTPETIPPQAIHNETIQQELPTHLKQWWQLKLF